MKWIFSQFDRKNGNIIEIVQSKKGACSNFPESSPLLHFREKVKSAGRSSLNSNHVDFLQTDKIIKKEFEEL